MTWIDQVLKATEENEAPHIFFYWAAMAAISAVVRKNVYLERYYYKLYPNIYVFLIAKSGMKKGIPPALVKSMLNHVNCTRVITGRNSVQAIVRGLSKAKSLEDGGVITDAHGLIVSGELASLLVKDPDALTILTDLHDTHAYEEEWTSDLVSSGTQKLKSPCITMLGATNEIHFSDAVPPNAVGGGFIARTFIVFADQRGTINSLTDKPKYIVSPKDLSCYLKDISKVKGEFKWAEDAKLTYNKWYDKYAIEERVDPTGTLERIPDQVLKAAMLISLSASTDLVLTKDSIEESLEMCLQCTAGVKQVTMGAGRSPLAYQTKLVLRELIAREDHTIQRQKFLSKYWGEVDSFDLDRIAETLIAAGAITVSSDRKTYVLKKSALEQYTRIKGMIQ